MTLAVKPDVVHRTYNKGDIFWADMGYEVHGRRPVVVTQGDKGNRHSSKVMIAPMSSSEVSLNRNYTSYVKIAAKKYGLDRDWAVVILNESKPLLKIELKDKRGSLDEEDMKRLDIALLAMHGIKEAVKEGEKMQELTIQYVGGLKTIDSREVADMLGKRHGDLLESIGGYIQYLENGEFRSQDFFIPGDFSVYGNNKTYKMYYITRKGCDMVANKMTGEKGVLFTAAYVTKFEEMEKALIPQTQTREQIIQAGYQALLGLVEEMKPKADYYDQLVDRNRLANFRDTAKELGIKESEFISFLETKRYIYRDSHGIIKPSSSYVPELFQVKEFISQRNSFTGTQTLITLKGREKFKDVFKGASLCMK